MDSDMIDAMVDAMDVDDMRKMLKAMIKAATLANAKKTDAGPAKQAQHANSDPIEEPFQDTVVISPKELRVKATAAGPGNRIRRNQQGKLQSAPVTTKPTPNINGTTLRSLLDGLLAKVKRAGLTHDWRMYVVCVNLTGCTYCTFAHDWQSRMNMALQNIKCAMGKANEFPWKQLQDSQGFQDVKDTDFCQCMSGSLRCGLEERPDMHDRRALHTILKEWIHGESERGLREFVAGNKQALEALDLV